MLALASTPGKKADTEKGEQRPHGRIVPARAEDESKPPLPRRILR